MKKNPRGMSYEEQPEIIHSNPPSDPDAFGIPAEAHLVPVYPRKRRAIGPKVTSPAALAEYLIGLGDAPVERMLCVLLNGKNEVMGVVIASQGSINEAVIMPREFFASAFEARAVAVIAVHNHPSGARSAIFSAADVSLTNRLKAAGEILAIPLLDHLLIAGDRWVSAKDQGMM